MIIKKIDKKTVIVNLDEPKEINWKKGSFIGELSVVPHEPLKEPMTIEIIDADLSEIRNKIKSQVIKEAS